MSQWYLGTIGYSYKDWLGAFYPAGMSQHAYLPFYSKVFNCVEMDTTFHSIPRQSFVQSWANSTPDDFRFSLKTPQLITHQLALKGTEAPMLEFIDAVKPLKAKIGPILIQLPPKYSQVNYPEFESFLTSLPPDNLYAVEFRHASWYNQQTVRLLSQYNVCWVATDYPNLPKQINITSEFIYIRWIGVNGTYQHHSYERVNKVAELRWWLDLLRSLESQVPVIYGFFNNDYAGFAAGTCKRFKQLAGFTDEEDNVPYQERLF